MGESNKKKLLKHIIEKNKVKKPKGLAQISMIALTILVIFGYSMLQVSAIHTGNQEVKRELSTGEKPNAWKSIQSIISNHLGDKNSDNSTTVNAQYLAWYDKKSIKKVKERETSSLLKCDNHDFPDIGQNPYRNDITKAAQYCLVSGYSNGKFYPDNHLKFGDFLTMLHNGFKHGHQKDIPVSTMKDLISLDKSGDQTLTNKDVATIIKDLYPVHKQEITLEKGDDIATRSYGVHVLNKAAPIEKDNLEDKENIVQLIASQDNIESIVYKGFMGMQRLLDNNIVDEFDESMKNPLSSISREKFLARLVKTKQIQNPSIPKNIQSVDYFKDTSDSLYKNELTLAKTMGYTSFLETIQRQETYLNPDKAITLFEAKTVINQASNLELPLQKEDDTVLLTYEKTATLLHKIILGVGSTNNNEINTTENKDGKMLDPWLVETIRPLVKKLTSVM